MAKHIQTMADHWPKLLICVLSALTIKVNCQAGQYVKITFLDGAVEKGAVCLDGSPAAYHIVEGHGKGADNWIVYLPGGGWCASKEDCIDRVKTKPNVSSTTNSTHTLFGGMLHPNKTLNPDFYNWNRVSIRYCDGASFAGDVEEVDPETNLHLRGSRIFGAVMDELLAKGMKNAKNAILAGTSAGGLATILNCDRFGGLLPNAKRVKCISDSGFFIHAKNLPNVDGRERGFGNTVKFHGIAKFLPKSCTSRMDPGLCFFPENLVGDIQTPLFLLNTAFDSYQIRVNLKPYNLAEKIGWDNCSSIPFRAENCTSAQLQIIKEFHDVFLETLNEIPDSSSRGMFINSCFIHDYVYSSTRWNSEIAPRLDKKTMAKAISDWYFDRRSVRLIDTHTDSPIDCKLPMPY